MDRSQRSRFEDCATVSEYIRRDGWYEDGIPPLLRMDPRRAEDVRKGLMATVALHETSVRFPPRECTLQHLT